MTMCVPRSLYAAVKLTVVVYETGHDGLAADRAHGRRRGRSGVHLRRHLRYMPRPCTNVDYPQKDGFEASCLYHCQVTEHPLRLPLHAAAPCTASWCQHPSRRQHHASTGTRACHHQWRARPRPKPAPRLAEAGPVSHCLPCRRCARAAASSSRATGCRPSGGRGGV